MSDSNHLAKKIPAPEKINHASGQPTIVVGRTKHLQNHCDTNIQLSGSTSSSLNENVTTSNAYMI